MSPRVVILGGGFAAIAAARALERLLRPDEAHVVVIGRENFTLFTPMLPEVCSGEIEMRHVVTPIRSQLRRTQFILGEALEIDLDTRRVGFRYILRERRETIAYDHLVIAVGSATSTFGLPGVAERVFALKTLEDAEILRNRFIWLLELADALPPSSEREALLRVAIVGGGFTGVETAGELSELFRDVGRFYPSVRPGDVRITLIEAASSLLAGLPQRMGEYARHDLERRGVEILLNAPVRGADESGLLLEGGVIATRTIVWSAGVRANPLAAAVPFERGPGGRARTAGDLSVLGRKDVWALGDAAAIPAPEGGFYPPTAQHALRQGPLLARNIVAVLRGRPTRAFSYRSLGMMASLGGRKAVMQLPGNRVLTGFLAWFIWRTYYLLRLPGLDRKLRVAFDWTLELLFPRDIAELRVYSRRAQSSAAEDAGLVPRERRDGAESAPR